MIRNLLVTTLLAITLLSACAPAGEAVDATLVPTIALPTATTGAAAPTAPASPTPAVTEPTAASAATAASTPAAPAPAASATAASASAALASAAPATDAPVTATSPSPTPLPPFDPAAWVDLPVIPTLSPRAKEILQTGLEMGRNPRAFSKIGDCESQTDWFLDHYDMGPENYSLGPYAAELQPVVDYYQGSFDRTSLAARQGFTAASLMAPIWSDRALCDKNEPPLACEIRTQNPLVAFIMVGTNDATNPPTFEKHMRKAIEYSISQGVLPILGTKADNVEGDHAINATMARLAHEYQVPLWNYWRAVQDLPGQGLQEDGAHLTFAAPYFDNPAALKKAWPVRNLNALQVLKVVMDEVESGE